MGDGILEAYTELGFGDVAPQAILAHEFGHQVQFAIGTFDNPISSDPAENTRRTELMADAYSAYYLSHARGATMQWKRVQQFLEVFFNIGDCGFSSPGHHGTPIQRMAAAQWGYDLANNAKKQGKILTSQEFADLFDAALPSLL
jgi:predicted metalloprotease